MCKELVQKVQRVSSNPTDQAATMIKEMVAVEGSGWGDNVEALRRIAGHYKFPFWTMNNIRIGRAKKIGAEVRDRIREIFVDHCRRHAARLLHKADVAEATGLADDDVRGIEDQIAALAARLALAKGDPKSRARQEAGQQ